MPSTADPVLQPADARNCSDPWQEDLSNEESLTRPYSAMRSPVYQFDGEDPETAARRRHQLFLDRFEAMEAAPTSSGVITRLPPCPTCKCTRHIRANGRWIRCDCLITHLRREFVLPQIRLGDVSYAPRFDELPPLPLRDLCIDGTAVSYDDFRFMVWRSLLPLYTTSFRYSCVRSHDLFDWYRTDQQARIQSLVDFGLLILRLGVPVNKAPGLLVRSVISDRRDQGLPTWVFLGLSDARIITLYGPPFAEHIAELLGPPVRDLSAVPPARRG